MGAGLVVVAIMRSLCAVRARESSGAPTRGRFLSISSIADFRLKLAGLLDQLLDRLFRGQDADEFAPGIDLFHALGEARRVAQREFADRGDAGSAHQPDLGLAHAGNPHVVGDVSPFQELLLADAGLRRSGLAALYGPGGF